MTKCIICDSVEYKLQYRVDTYDIVKCKHCGLSYLYNPLPIEQDVVTYNHYFHQAKIFPYQEDSENLVMKTLWMMNEQRLTWITQAKPQGALLDIGSGRGYFLRHAAGFGYDVEGVEISSVAAAYCEQTYQIKPHIINIEQEVIRDRKYDIITMWHVLEHFANPLRVLFNVKTLLNDDGVLFIEVPNIKSLKFLISAHNKKFVGGNHPRHHRYFFSARTLSMLMSKAGFTNSQIMINAYHLPHHNALQKTIKQLLKLLQLDSFINVCATI